ncbi:unnamed protein product [Phytomonas sp. Hart1]|nr:unnamed protein product [Phytomonas sp. Hart1]|eukprot:CCW66221.1 unnamed protein product [Phytomonas sp. isolate Hart1]
MYDNRKFTTWRQLLWSCFYTHSFTEDKEPCDTTSKTTRVMREDDFYASMRVLVKDVRCNSTSYFPKENKSDVELILCQLSSVDILRRVWIKLISRQKAHLEKKSCDKNLNKGKSCILRQMHNHEQVQYSNGIKKKSMMGPAASVEWDVFSAVLLTHIKDVLNLQQNPVGSKNYVTVNSNSDTLIDCIVDPFDSDCHLNRSHISLSRVTISMSSVSNSDISNYSNEWGPEAVSDLDQELSLMLKTGEIDIACEGFPDTVEKQCQEMKSKSSQDTPRSVWSSLLNIVLPPVLKSTVSPDLESHHCGIKHTTINPSKGMRAVSTTENNPEHVKGGANGTNLLVPPLKSKTRTLPLDNNIDSIPLGTLVPPETGNTIVESMVNNRSELQTIDESCGKFVNTKTYMVMSTPQNPNPHSEGHCISIQQRFSTTINDKQPPSASKKLMRRWTYPFLEVCSSNNKPTQLDKGSLPLTYPTKSKTRELLYITNPFKFPSTTTSSGSVIHSQEQEVNGRHSAGISQYPGIQMSPPISKLSFSYKVADDSKKSPDYIYSVIAPPPYSGCDKPSKEVCSINHTPTSNSVDVMGNSNERGENSFRTENCSKELATGTTYKTPEEVLTPIAPLSYSSSPVVEANLVYQRYASQPYISGGSFSVGATSNKRKWNELSQVNRCKLNGLLSPPVTMDQWQNCVDSRSRENASYKANCQKKKLLVNQLGLLTIKVLKKVRKRMGK